MERYGRRFYARDVLTVARSLLGQLLFHELPDGLRSGRILEVEAYTGSADPASHAYRGPTTRNRVMFGPPGYLYVYFIYGMYYCCNVVAERDGIPGAVLIRSLAPVDGIGRMRAEAHAQQPHRLADGPGKVCRALRITGADNGVDLVHGPIGVARLGAPPAKAIKIGPRIGITRGAELPYRFCLSELKAARGAGRGRVQGRAGR